MFPLHCFKALTMNNESRKVFTTGAIVNLMSVDCNRVEGCVSQLFQLWSAPLSIMLCFYFLYQVIGVSMVAGLAVMVVMAPLNYKLVFYMKKLHNKQLSIKDERLKNMNEILNGIKVIIYIQWKRCNTDVCPYDFDYLVYFCRFYLDIIFSLFWSKFDITAYTNSHITDKKATSDTTSSLFENFREKLNKVISFVS